MINLDTNSDVPLLLTNKPWGKEYQVCICSESAMWCLSLNYKASTSLHCHFMKRTGYVVLNGSVNIEFLSGNRTLNAGDFINFRPGLFHKTTALSKETILLEIESPNNKNDLLRLEDASGRKFSHIENPIDESKNNNYLFLQDNFKKIFIEKNVTIIFKLNIKLINIEEIDDIPYSKSNKSFIAVLNGLFMTNSSFPLKPPQRLLGPGDVISVSNLNRMKHVINCESIKSTCLLFEPIK